ncbi:IS3 family transposase [Pseudodesulfovibrio profundus]|nr:IS3 family transposase [Pseudodesulfovibrio profundus]
MRKSKFSEYQIVKILKAVEGGRTVVDVCREHGVSSATYYKWKSKYGGMEASDIQRMKDLETENRKLKQMFADLSLENMALKDVIEKKPLRPVQRKEFVMHMVNAFELSLRKACAAMGISRSYYAYKPHPRDDSDVIAALTELAEKKPTWGFSKLFNVLRQQDKPWNHKKVWRVYCLLKMNLKRKAKKRLPQASRTAVAQPLAPNYCWSIDFMRDTLYSGRVFRTFNAVDDYNREALAVEIDTNMPAGRVVRVLDRVAEERGGYPERLRMDNGPEFSGTVMAAWAESHGVNLEFIQPGKPTQNSYIERFNRTYREEVLDLYVFNSLSEVRAITEDFIREYNEERPHESLGNMSPINFAAQRAGGTPYPLGNPPKTAGSLYR